MTTSIQPTTELYVYYSASPSQFTEALRASNKVLEALQSQFPGEYVVMKRYEDQADGLITMMEVCRPATLVDQDTQGYISIYQGLAECEFSSLRLTKGRNLEVFISVG